MLSLGFVHHVIFEGNSRYSSPPISGPLPPGRHAKQVILPCLAHSLTLSAVSCPGPTADAIPQNDRIPETAYMLSLGFGLMLNKGLDLED